jgi:selenocysteine lyase/cysteine desulfurase
MSDTPSDSVSGYAGNVDQFPILRNWDFFNHAGVSPMPHVAAEAMRKHAAESEQQAYVFTSWYTDVEKLRILAASAINADRDEIAFIKNTSEGISIVAGGVEWQFGDRVVTTAVEYPANIYPWMEVVRSRGVKLIMVPEETDSDGRRIVPIEKILNESAYPRTGDRWSGIVTFTSAVHDHEQIVRVLRKQHRTEIALREGRLRVSPHFYNTIEQIDRLIDHLPGH